ncbi:hypothetical protein [Sphingobium cloacae]|uniref:EVE domain-containing protein n=1 Tax=Sphingobium cloacae TaxID=120107 RepID=A0A1E1F129_9SPHN|nr:hypothetical protein [Sphingobium cloacae]BAV64161.1 hypothetical protein SCLO_1011210 [Sphingobium cloacae]
MDIYVFASSTLTNIWAGVGSKTWAVSRMEAGSPQEKGRRTKARKMPVGALGILYSSEDKALTVPFIVHSKPDENAEVAHIWPEKWVLPFRIKPLGNPHARMTIEQAKAKLPSFKNGQPFNNLFRVRADFAFQTSQILPDDWAILIEELAN